MPRQIDHLAVLDPDADPRTPLGELRARYLPVWTSDFDWAFPPDVCDSAWELDAIAVPVSDVDISLYGDPVSLAALAVMRYEHLLSEALAESTPLAQLCIAVGSVGRARTEAMELQSEAINNAESAHSPPALASRVTVVAISPSAALAVACVPASNSQSPEAAGTEAALGAPVRLGAYLLRVSQGVEDAVRDISYRVSVTVARVAESCAAVSDWTAEWTRNVESWLAEGRIWELANVTMTSDSSCADRDPVPAIECLTREPA